MNRVKAIWKMAKGLNYTVQILKAIASGELDMVMQQRLAQEALDELAGMLK